MSALHAAARHARTLVVSITLIVGIAVPMSAGAADSRVVHANLTGAERAFAKVFKTDMTTFAHSVDAAAAPLGKLSGKSTVAEIVAATMAAGTAWNKAIKPVLALKAPPQLTQYWNLLAGYLRSGGSSLLGMAQAARNHNERTYLADAATAQSSAQGVSTTAKFLARTLSISLPALTL